MLIISLYKSSNCTSLPHLTQESMLVCVLQPSAELRASPTGSGFGRIGGMSSTRGLWDTETWRWTTNAARPSKWAALSNEHFGQERFVKVTSECTD